MPTPLAHAVRLPGKHLAEVTSKRVRSLMVYTCVRDDGQVF
jgi:hypothetical protein